MEVTNFVCKNWCAVFSKNETIEKMTTVQDGTVKKTAKYRYIFSNSATSFTTKILTTVFCTPSGKLLSQ
jgi:hypothetical protein